MSDETHDIPMARNPERPRRVIKTGRRPNVLPEAGFARDEELRRRRDDLAELADQANAEAEGGVIDPSVFEVENELAQHFNELEVTQQAPGFDYSWTFTGQHGFFIKWKLSRKWQVVSGDMKEADELKQADGTRRLGDVILMRIPTRLHEIQLQRDRERGKLRLEAAASNLEDMARQYAGRGISVRQLNEGDPHMKAAMDRAHAKQLANHKLGDMVRTGSVPGRPMPSA